MEEVVVVPACGFDFGFDGAAGFAGVGFEKIERPAAQCGEVLGGVAGAGAALVFAEDHVEHPVELVFDAPVAAHGAGEPGRIQTQAAQVVATFDAGAPVGFTHGFDHSDAVQTLPFAAVGKPADVGALPVAARFEATVAFFHLLAVDQRGVCGGDGGINL